MGECAFPLTGETGIMDKHCVFCLPRLAASPGGQGDNRRKAKSQNEKSIAAIMQTGASKCRRRGQLKPTPAKPPGVYTEPVEAAAGTDSHGVSGRRRHYLRLSIHPTCEGRLRNCCRDCRAASPQGGNRRSRNASTRFACPFMQTFVPGEGAFHLVWGTEVGSGRNRRIETRNLCNDVMANAGLCFAHRRNRFRI